MVEVATRPSGLNLSFPTWLSGSTEEGIHGSVDHSNSFSMGYGPPEYGRNGYCRSTDPRALSPSGKYSNGEGMNGYHHGERHSDGPEELLTRTHSWPQLCSAQQQIVGEEEHPEAAESTGLVLREHSDSALTVSPAVLQRLSSSPSQGLSHGGEDAAPREESHNKRALFGFGKAKERKKKDKEKKAAARSDEGTGLIGPSGQEAPDGSSSGRGWAWWPRAHKAAERSVPSSSSGPSSLASKLFDLSEEAGNASGPVLASGAVPPAAAVSMPPGHHNGSGSDDGDSAGGARLLLESVASPPTSMAGCLSSVFARGRSEDVPARAALLSSGASDAGGPVEKQDRRRKGNSPPAPAALPALLAEATARPVPPQAMSAAASSSASSSRSSFDGAHSGGAGSAGDAAQATSSFATGHLLATFGGFMSSPFAAIASQAMASGQEGSVSGHSTDADKSSAGGRDKPGKVTEASSAPPKAQAEAAPPPAKKGAHRRGNSLSGLLPMLLPKRTPSLPGKLPPDAAAAPGAATSTQAASDVAPAAAGKEATPPSPKTPRAAPAEAALPGVAIGDAQPPAPKTPDALQRNASAALSCFGLGPKQATAAADGGEEVEGGANSEAARPPGVIGLKNNGNTCFINAALQLICHTPGLAELLVPNLLNPPPSSDAGASSGAQQEPMAQRSPLQPSAAAGAARAVQASSAGEPAVVAVGAARALEAGEAACLIRLPVVPDMPALPPLPTIAETAPVVPDDDVLPLPALQPALLARTPAAFPAADRRGAAEGSTAADPHAQPAASATDDPADRAEASPSALEGVTTASREPKRPTTSAAPDALAQPEPEHIGPHTPANSDTALLPPSLHASPEAAWGQAAAPAPSTLAVHSMLSAGPCCPPQPAAPSGAHTEDAELHGSGCEGPAAAAQLPRSEPEQAAAASPPAAAQDPATAQTAGRIQAENATTDAASGGGGGAGASEGAGSNAIGGEPRGDLAAAAQPAQAVEAAPMTARRHPPLRSGELSAIFEQLLRQMYGGRSGGAAVCVDPGPFIHALYALPHGADFQDGGQHDCQEALRGIINALHDDLNRVKKPPPPPPQLALQAPGPASNSRAKEEQDSAAEQPGKDAVCVSVPEAAQRDQALSHKEGAPEVEEEQGQPESEAAKAERLLGAYLSAEASPITDLFLGQLQSCVTCHKCSKRFTMYEPFLDLSLPLTREGKGGGGLTGWLSGKSAAAPSIQDCLQAFTADETMQGDEAFQCEVCGERTAATKHLRLHRLPRVLLLHIKRFRCTGATREKITTNVTFPLKDLHLHQFLSDESGLDEAAAGGYELFAVSNHYGNLVGGHYTAFCKAPSPVDAATKNGSAASGDGSAPQKEVKESAPKKGAASTKDSGALSKELWFSYNDEVVTKINASNVASPCAYILCYHRRGI